MSHVASRNIRIWCWTLHRGSRFDWRRSQKNLHRRMDTQYGLPYTAGGCCFRTCHLMTLMSASSRRFRVQSAQQIAHTMENIMATTTANMVTQRAYVHTYPIQSVSENCNVISPLSCSCSKPSARDFMTFTNSVSASSHKALHPKGIKSTAFAEKLLPSNCPSNSISNIVWMTPDTLAPRTLTAPINTSNVETSSLATRHPFSSEETTTSSTSSKVTGLVIPILNCREKDSM
mmetsp:Transcript_20254/g.54074  ORF Transcript_20254/g.54074 Transcript_20254/m.54074 type:complete len:232 (+) Transcript_20254:184-879(+)